MKKILFLLLCILAGAQTVKAQRAYAFFYEDQQVLKFFYDDQLTVRLNNPQQKPDKYYTAFYSQALGDQPAWYWDNSNAKIKTVNFDSSFKDYKPYKLSYFFAGMIQLSSIINIQFLNTSETTNMQGMFAGCSAITRLDFYYLNTQNVVNFNDMFTGCKKLNTIYIGALWNTNKATSSYGMFQDCKSIVGGAGTTYDANHTDASYAHADQGAANPGYLTGRFMSYANFNNGTLTFYYDNLSSTRTGTNYEMNEGSNDPAWSLVSSQITNVKFDPSFAEARRTTTCKWFSGCTNLTSITGWENLNTSEVTNMREMFSDCSKLTNLNLNKFNTSNVTTMYGMFARCSSLGKLSLSYLFSTANVTDMDSMFLGCSSLTNFGFLTYFNTAKVAEMQYMFKRVSAAETLDLSSFNTKNVIAMKEMFRECSELRTIYISSGWSTDKVTSTNNFTNMFLDCTKIRGMQGTTYNASYVDKTYARLDEGTSKPGYLSTITYNLKVGGVEVTDMNKDNIPITSGTAKFNGSVLFLTDATIAGNASWGSIHCTRDNLTIAVNGSCTLNGTVNFRGSSYIFTDNDDDDELTVNGMFNFKGSLQFYNRKTVISTSASYMFMGDGTTSKLEFGKNATVIGIMNGGTQIAYNITGLTFKSPTSFTFGSLGADDSQVSFSATQKTILMDGQPLKGILAVGQYYPLWFGDLQMSSTIPLYLKSLLSQDAFSISEADDGTLVMKTYPLFAVITYNNNTFRSEAENLRVELGCDWTAKSEDANTPAMELKGNTTITGTGKLTVESAHEGINHNVRGANLTFDGLDIEINAVHSGIIGYMNFSSNNNPSFYNTLTFKDCTASITSKGEGNPTYSWLCIAQEKDLVLSGCHITNGVTFTNNSIYAPQVIIGLGGSYDLNGDGKVSTADIQVIINEMKKPQASQNMDYDLNNDGKISTADIQVIINEMKK